LIPHFCENVLAIENMTVDIFLLTVKEIYGSLFSELAAHKISFLGGKIPETMKDIEVMSKSIGVVPDSRMKFVVLEIVKPMLIPFQTTSSSVVKCKSHISYTSSVPSSSERNFRRRKRNWKKNQFFSASSRS